MAARAEARGAGRCADPAAAGVAGYLAALFGALVAAGLALLGNPYALVLALPALHLWLVLPSLARLGLVARLSIVGLGWIGPALLIVALAGPVSLGGSRAALGRAPAVGGGAASRRRPLARDAVRRDLAAHRDRQRPLRERQHLDDLAGRSILASGGHERQPVGERGAAELM